jgi:hypothetical protein
MTDAVFGGDKILYRAWSDEAKKAYNEVVRLAKDMSPEEIKKIIESSRKR